MMNIVAKPHYRLPPDYLWLRKFRNNKKVLARLRNRAIKAFEFSIKGDNPLNYRISCIAAEIMERYWAARYPDIVDVPKIEIYNASCRGDLFYRANNNIGALTNFADTFEMPITNKYMRFRKEEIAKLRQ